MGQQLPAPPYEAGAVESVVIALHKVIGLLDRIKNAIEESSNKIPKAAIHLHTVTQATETATVEILDVLDTMVQNVGSVEKDLDSLRKSTQTPETHSTLTDVARRIAEVNADTMAITIALQVQDITAQKIAAVNHLIESVRKELLQELSYLEGASGGSVGGHKARPGENTRRASEAFDNNASYTKSADVQHRIDRVIEEWNASNLPSESLGQQGAH
ncbi:MAG: hypothetical protein A2X66_00565 [Ignavibacteria bacterium GWA2_54_16]|nr:MAG: hypothetical protein A2X66_00565 [Ignavibacteria bacterium GWA2_54_16]